MDSSLMRAAVVSFFEHNLKLKSHLKSHQKKKAGRSSNASFQRMQFVWRAAHPDFIKERAQWIWACSSLN
jgi:hypothetical protein